MKAALSQLTLVRPRNLRDALAKLHDSLAGERLTPIAGGTDLFVYLNAGTLAATRYLDLAPLAELRGIRARRDGGVRIGALATFTEIGAHAAVRRAVPSLAAAARVVGAAQIQNRGTLGGNVANASPAGDSLPVLLAHDAVVHAASVRGERAVPFASLHTGYRRLALEPDELITAIEIPASAPRTVTFFRKVGTRAAQSISKVVFAAAWHAGRGRRADHVRLAWGSLAATPVRSAGAEAALLGALPGRDAAAAALAALANDVSPIDDVRSDREYRAHTARALLAQFLRVADPAYDRAG